MSDWKKTEIADKLSEKTQDWLDLWEFNSFNPSCFWFGSIVYLHDRPCRVLGMEWRFKEMAIRGLSKAGWWYRVQWLPHGQSLQGIHEDSLSFEKK